MKSLFLIFAFTLLSFSSNLIAVDLSEFKQKCESIGFKKGTEKFGECVLKLRDMLKASQRVNQKFKQKCESIGFKKGTEKFGNCVFELRDRFRASQQADQKQLQAQIQREEKKKLQVGTTTSTSFVKKTARSSGK